MRNNRSVVPRKYEGYKEFEVLIIPRLAGDIKIPPISVSYFDPKAVKYVSQTTPAFQIKVLPGDGAAPGAPNVPLATGVDAPTSTPVVKDIKYLKTAPEFELPADLQKIGWSVIFFLLIGGFSIAFYKLKKFDPSDLTGVVKRRVREKMKVARVKHKTGDTKGVGIECSNAILATLGEVTGSGGVSLTAGELLRRLPKGSEKLQDEIQRFLSVCEIVSFAPAELAHAQSDVKDLKSLVGKTERLISALFELK